MTDSLLDRAIYSYTDVDRLVGLRAGTAKRSLEGYEHQGHYGPVLREKSTGSDSVTWGEMVEARFLAELLRPDPRTPDVAMDPRRTFGQPAVRNVRTDVLAEDYRAGTSREELADLYDLSLEQVDGAIRCELIAGSERAA